MSRVDSIYGCGIVTRVGRNNPFDLARYSQPSIFSSWLLEFEFTRFLEKTTCWSISGENFRRGQTKSTVLLG